MDKMKLAIQKAQKLIKEIQFETEEQKNIAFAKAINYFLHHEEKNKIHSSNLLTPSVNSQNISEFDFWNLLEKESNLSRDVLKDIYVLNKDQVLILITKIKGQNRAEKCSHISLLLCFAYHYGKKMEWVPAKYLVEAVRHLNFNVRNFNRDLRNEWFRKKGKKKGVEYKLSAPGFLEAKKYLNELKNYGFIKEN